MFAYVFVAIVGGALVGAAAGQVAGIIAGLALAVAGFVYDQTHSA
jgi:hypothetical protein